MAPLGEWLRGLRRKQESAPEPPLARARTRPDPPRSFAEGNNEFALAMFGQLGQRTGNVFFSPFSIRTALAMTEAGAAGETARQMREALCISSSGDTTHAGFAETVSRLNAASEYEMAVANSLWGEKSAPLRPAFLELIARYYGGTMNLVDFRGGADAARLAMNQWVEEHTGKKIRELVPPGGVDELTRLVLINAVYFKGMWVLPFRKSDTRDEPFYLEEGGEVEVPLMHQETEIRYMQGAGFQAVELLYRGDLSMLILLPGRRDGLRDLEPVLSASGLRDCVAKMISRPVSLFLPRFKMDSGTINVYGHLKALGMSLAFTRGKADFSGINGCKPADEESLFISDVWHKATVDVNEEGTEAAAATAVSMVLGLSMNSTPLEIPTFRADHPFVFAIRDRKSRAILFLGRIADPT